MSKVIDERVVEMRFDNKQFESNVAQSMSTLQKLKQSLKFKGASDGIDDINRAAKSVDMNPLGRGVEAVSAKFSALQVMGTTALVNITNQAVNAGKRIVSALTIDPVKSGFQEYETQINAVQTILANTQKEGTTITDVNAALDELNAYADKTIYNFTEMTRNIGTFTAAGVKLDTSVNAIQGIANLAAISGSTSQQASTAMYQLSQALASGTVKLMDWNSVVNAGMGGQVFQDALKETARVHGIAIDQMIEDEGSFRETLSKGWLTADILTETLQKFTLATEGLTNEQIQANREMLRSKGYTEEQIDEIFKLGNTATNAATKVKTLTQLWDVLKEAAQSGWSQTWRLIIGDFEEAKAIFTPLADFFTNIIGKMSDARNELLESAFAKGFSELSEKFNAMLKPAKEAMSTVQSVTNAITDLDGVVSSVIRGDFGNGKTRYDALTEAGYNWYVVQNKVNETLGCSKRYTQEQIDAQNELLGVQNKLVGVQNESVESAEELDKTQKRLLISRIKMKEEDLEELGYTEDQIAAFKELGETAKKLGIPLSEFIDNLDEINGRWLLINSFKNIGRSLVKVFSSIGRAWKRVFKPITSDKIFDVIAAFHKFTTQLTRTYNVVPKLTRTFKGLFSLLHIISTIAGGGLRLAFSIIARLMKSMGLSILDVTAKLGDAITKFHDFIFENELITKGFDKLAEGIEWVSKKITSLFDTIANSKFVKTVGEAFKELYNIWFGKGGETEDANSFSSAIGTVSGALSDLNSGDKASVFSTISEGINAISQLANTKWAMSLTSGLKILNAVLELFGTNLARIGEDVAPYIIKLRDWVKENTFLINTNGKIAVVLKTLIDGIKKCADAFMALKPVQKIIEKIRKLISDLFGDFSNGINGITTSGLEKIFDTISKWISGLENSENLGLDIVKGLANGIKAAAKWVVDAILNLGQTIIVTFKELLGIASPSWIFYILGVFVVLGLAKGIEASSKFVKEAVSFLAAEIIGFFKSEGLANLFKSLKNGLLEFYYFIKGYLTKFANFVSTLNFKQILMSMIPIGAVIISLKKLYDIADTIADGIKGVNKVVDSFGGLLKSGSNVLNAYANTFKSKNLMRMAISIAILAASLIALTFVDPDKLWNAVAVLGIIASILILLAKAMNELDAASATFTKKDGLNISGLKSGLIAIGAAILLIAAAVKLIGSMKPEEATQGFAALGAMALGLILMVGVFSACAKLLGANAEAIKSFGSSIFTISLGMLLMVKAVKMIAEISWEDLIKGGVVLGAFTIFIGILAICLLACNRSMTVITSTEKGFIASSKGFVKIGGTILAIAFSMLIMIAAMKLIGTLSAEEILAGLTVLGAYLLFIGLFTRLINVVTKKTTKNGTATERAVAKIGGMLISIAVSMLLMVAVCKLAGKLTPSEMLKGITFVALFLLFVKKLTKITTISDKQKTAKVASTILAFSIAIAVLVGLSILLGMLSLEQLAKGVTAVSILASMMALMVRAAKGTKDIAKTITQMAIAIGVMTAAAIVLAFIPEENLKRGVVALVLLMLFFAAMEKALPRRVSKNMWKSVLILSGVVILLAGILYAMDKLHMDTALNNVEGLAALMLSFAVSMRIMAGMKSIRKSAMKGMAAMLGITIVLGGILWAFSKLNVSTSLSNVAGLSVLMLAFAVSMRIMAGMKGISKTAIEGMIAMSVVTIVLGGILWAFSKLNVSTSLSNVAGLSVLMLAFAVSMRIMAGMKGISKTAIEGMIAMSVVTIILALVLAGLSKLEVDVAFDTALSLSVLLLALAGVTVILSKFGPVASTAASGALAMSAVVGILGGLIVAIGALCTSTKFSKLEEFLDKGIPILEKIGTGIGSFFGGLLAGLGSGFAEMMAKVGLGLNLFMLGARGFITGLKDVDPDSISAADTLCGAILALTGAGLLNRLTSFLGTPMDELGAQLSTFAEGLVAFSGALTEGNFDAEKVQAAADVGMAMADLQGSIDPIGGLLQELTGVGDLSDFGEQIKDYAAALIATCGALSLGDGTSCLKADLIREAADVGMAMADLQGAISPVGGILQELIGVGDLSDFGKQIKEYGAALVAASGALTLGDGTSAIHADIIREAADAGMAMADLQGAISPVGGILQELIGVGDLSNFGKQIKEYGAALVAASGALTLGDGTSAIHPEAIEDAATAGMTLAGLQGSIKPIGGIVQDIMGVTDLGDFGKQIKTYFEQLKIASESLTGEDGTININNDAIQTAVDAGKKLAILQRYIPEDTWFDGKTNLAKFGEKIVSFGVGISDFSTSLADLNIDNMTAGITAANRLATLAKRLVDLDTSGITKFKNVKNIGTVIKDYYGEVMNISPDILESSVGSAIRLKNMVAGLVSVDPSGIENFKVDGIGEAIKSYYNKVSSIDTTLLYLSITNATRLRDFITSLIGFDGDGVASFVEALDTLGTADLQSVIAAFSSGAEEMFSIGQNFINNFLTGIQQSQVLLTNMFVTTISLIFSTIRNTGTSFVAAGRYIMTRFANGMRTQVRYVTTAATSSLSNAVRSIRLYYSNFKDAGKYLGQGLIDGMNAKQQEAYNAGHALGKISARGVKDGAQEQSPSKLTTQYGEYLGEGLVIGMGNTLGAVYKQGKELGKGAATSVYNALNGAADAANVDYTPSIRPVVDLTSFRQNTGNLQIGADISSRLLSGPVNSLQQIVANAQSDITASNNEVIKAINGLREDLNMYYSSDDKEIALYMDTKKVASTIAKPMNRELNILAKRGAY